MPLCDVCTGLDISRHLTCIPRNNARRTIWYGNPVDHHASIEALRDAARAGCELCGVLQSVLPLTGPSGSGLSVTDEDKTYARDQDLWLPASRYGEPSDRGSVSIQFVYRTFHVRYAPVSIACTGLEIDCVGLRITRSSLTLAPDGFPDKAQAGGAIVQHMLQIEE